MNKSWFVASLLSMFAAIVRTVDGHSGPLAEARGSAMSQPAISFFHVTWYFMTLVFVIAAVAFFRLARGERDAPARAQARLLAVLFFAAATSLCVNASVFGFFPAVFVAIGVTSLTGVLALLGARQTGAS